MILFLTNNYKVTKPLTLWLKRKDKVIIYDKKLSLQKLKKINPSLIISYNYQHIIKKEILKKYKIINLHISYLPFNRGADPNIWSFIENTKKGVSIHYIDEKIDTGDIIAQKRVTLSKKDNLKNTYKKLHFHIQMLFKSKYNHLTKIKPKKQKNGTIHYKKDLIKYSNCINYEIPIEKILECINENRKN
jgi:methionyl-tRNA formyltransferase